MFEKPAISEFLKQASKLIPESAANVRAEFEQNLRPLIEKQLANFNLVTREEFNSHLALLERLNAQVTELESELNALKQDNAD